MKQGEEEADDENEEESEDEREKSDPEDRLETTSAVCSNSYLLDEALRKIIFCRVHCIS